MSALASGDETALAALIDRHVRAVHDFALRATLDEARAVSLTETTFRRVTLEARSKPADVGFRAWLYCLELLEVQSLSGDGRESGVSMTDERLFRSTADLEPDVLLWAWHAARSLRTGDYCILDLLLRRGLPPGDLTEAAKATGSALYANLAHIRAAFTRNFNINALYARGGSACERLAGLLNGSERSESAWGALRETIGAHSQSCLTCRSTISNLPSGEHVFVSIQDVEAPADLAPRTFAAVRKFVLPAQPEPGPESEVALDSEPEAEPAASPPAAVTSAATVAGAASEPDTKVEAVEPQAAAAEDSGRQPAQEDSKLQPAPERLPDQGTRPAPGRIVGGWAGAFRKTPIRWSYLLLGIATVAAIYVGIAVADSIRSGGQASGAVPLDAGLNVVSGRAIDCSSPIQLGHGRSSAVNFDGAALAGFELTEAVLQSDSPDPAGALSATLDGPFSIVFQAAAVEPGSQRVDEYRLLIHWRRGDEVATSQCRVEVSATGAGR